MKDPIGICLIGCGRAGMIHARNFASRIPHAKMTAVSDVSEETGRSAAKELGVDRWYADYRRALEDPQVDAVVIASPTKYHRGIAVAAARAKKQIFCEKPMAMEVSECAEMIRAAEENGVALQIGFMRRFDASFRRAKEIVDAGAIGAVVLVKSLPRGPRTPHEWMYDIRKSNGPLAEVNSHDIDTLRWLTGSEAESLYGLAGNYRCADVREKYPDFYDTVLLSLRMKNGAMGSIDGAQGVRYGYDARVDILGTKGCVQIGGLRDKTTLVFTKENGMAGDVVKSWMDLFKEAYAAEDGSFIERIRSGEPPLVTGRDGMMAVAIVKAGNESIRTGNVVRV